MPVRPKRSGGGKKTSGSANPQMALEIIKELIY